MMKTMFPAKFLRLGLALLLVISIIGAAVVPAGQAASAAESSPAAVGTDTVTDAVYAAAGQISATDATYKTAEYILGSGVTSEWQAIGLAQAGYRVPDSYVQSLTQQVQTAGGRFASVTEYARIVLAVKALGADPADFAGNGSTAGYNLLERIYNNEKISGQTLNYPVYALLALDSGNYTIPGNAKWTKAALLTEILSKQNADGGFALNSGASEPDITAMALTALSAYKSDPAVASAGQKAVAWLSAAQDSKGGYGDNSESAAQVIIGLTSFGIDPAGVQFTKNGADLIGRLLSFQTSSGGFIHNAGGSINPFATEQGLQALVAYKLFSGGSNGKLYDFTKPAAQNPLVYVPLVIEGPQGTLGQGNAYAGNALEALEKVAAQNGLALKNPSGSYVTGIGNVFAGTYGGWDGWMYAVVRGGQWLNPDVGMKDFKLKDSDRVVVYYAGSDTQLVESVTLSKAQPGEEEPFTVTVNQIKWVWDNTTFTSSPVISKAAGVEVAIGDQKAVTDKDGKAEFTAGVAAGDYTLTVTGYVAGAAPKVAKYTQAITVVSKKVSAYLAVEGPDGTVAEGALKAANVLEALKKLTASQNIPLQITDSAYGSYVSGIAGITNGIRDAYWNFVVLRSGEWIYPSVGMGDFELQAADKVLVYFGGTNTQIVDKVVTSPLQPKPGEPFTIKVTQKKWVWNNTTSTSDPVVSPAVGVQVTLAGTTLTTDSQGQAVVEKGLSSKIYTVAVTGYAGGAAPKVARYTQSLKVAPGNVSAHLSIEGPQGPLAEGTLDAYNAFDALQQLAASGGIPLQSTESSYGIFVWGIGGIENGAYSPNDYWGFAVSRGGAWIYPDVGLNDFVLQPSDKVLVYYTGANTQVVNSLAVSPAQPKPGEPFTVTVEQKKWVWNNTTYTSDPVTSKAEGIQVSSGGVTATTNAEGVASFQQGLPAGSYSLAVTGYVEGKAPNIARYTQPLTVSAPFQASATISVIGDSVKGTILPGTTVILNDGETAYSLLVRQLGSKVVSSGTGSDIYIRSIDGLGEGDRGPESGWMYSVNGEFPNYSAASYKLSNGDTVAWRYTVKNGDLGGSAAGLGGTGTTVSGVDITADNTLPLDRVLQTTAVSGTVMTRAEAAALKQSLSANVASFEQDVTPAAASLKDSGGEVELKLPAGAVSGTLKISVRESSANRPELVSGLYDFKPDGTKFLKTADLLIKIPVTTANPANLALAWLDESTGNWIPVPASLDLKTGIMTGKVSHFTTYAVVDRSKFEPKQAQLISDIAATAKMVTAAGELSDWQALGLARSGHSVPAGYLSGVKERLAASQGEFRKVTDYERLVLAVAAAGGNPQSFGGYNLIEKIYSNDKMASQGSNGLIFGLIALDSGSYSVPAGALWTKERLIQAILELQSKDGGFPLTAGGTDDVDLTAMAVSALSSHAEQAAVQTALDKAVTWLSQQQLENGGYKLSGVENSESTAQVIIALSAAGVGPGDARFVKAKGGLLSHLASFRLADGGYVHAAGQPENSLATEQALLALTAYSRFLTGDSKLFSISPAAVSSTVFTDESRISSWALDSVHAAYDQGLMKGVSETDLVFAPKQQITRAEFAALLLRLMNQDPSAAAAAPVFSDVKPGAWYYGAVLKAKELGIISGVSDKVFNPGGAITRQDMAVMISRAFKLENAASAAVQAGAFTDESRISSYALSAVRTASELGYMTGFNGAFDPAATVTREMAAVVAVRLPQ
ncbi:DUF4430 domain-containing protein [Paenibacillus tianjinensis]|uniref:DUF4430 domain-containing protein n=1 Tax=Paenibacillus tianjinensis TaxID=2810347 RepID=A0ABX7LCA6_9BACL|nr:DUF4430 domain-containing protein [Paenibacillus tianjinensis]QSF45765.1 DUF4430 domain-containing protein [Paenibacillus tianjinensis]